MKRETNLFIVFYNFSGICLILGTIMLIATVYENYLESNSYDVNISSKGDLKNGIVNEKPHLNELENNRKNFELYQITTTDNNNTETELTTNKQKNDTNCDSKKKSIGIITKIILCFSIKSNSRTILSVDRLPNSSLTCIHGLKTISLLWTIMVHTYLQLFAIGQNKNERMVAERSFGYQIIGNATYSVDTFFYISGLLVTLLFLRSKKDDNVKSSVSFIFKSLWNSFLFLFYRFIRLTPVYLFVIFANDLLTK